MKLDIKKAFSFLILFTTFYSCSSIKNITVLLCLPPSCPIPNEVQRIAVLNRSMNNHFVNFTSDSISVTNRTGNNYLNFSRTFYDSVAADSTVIAAAKTIFKKQRFDIIVPIERNIFRVKRRNEGPLDSSFVSETCKNYQVDGLLVLEKFSQELTRRIHSNLSNTYSGRIKVTSNSGWKFYQMGKQPMNLVLNDEVSWEAPTREVLNREILSLNGEAFTLYKLRQIHSLANLYKELPTIKEALVGGGNELGLEMGNQFIPNWRNELRNYYSTGRRKIDTAVVLIYDNKWKEAEEIWLKYDSVKSPVLRSKIEHNLALCAEVNGNIDDAIKWASKSLKTRYHRSTELYLKKLELYRSKMAVFRYNVAPV